MKNLLLYLGLSFGLVTFQVQAMDNQKQLVNTSPQKSPQKLQVQGVWDSPDKRFLEGSIDQIFSPFQPDNPSKQEVESPIKIGGLTRSEWDQFASYFNSPEKVVKQTAQTLNSPDGEMTLGFNDPELCFNQNIDQKIQQLGVSGLIVTSFQSPNQIRLNAIAAHAKSAPKVAPKVAPMIIFDSNVYEKEQERPVEYRALKKLSEVVPVYVFNVWKQFKNRSGKTLTLHGKTYSWISENGNPRVCGLGSNNGTQQAVKNQEMSLYLKGAEAKQVRQVHELFAKSILPYCTKYKDIATAMQGSIVSQTIDFSNLPLISTLPPASPTLPLSSTLVFAYTNSVNWRPFVNYFLKEKARKVSAYSISDEYLTAVEKNSQCALLVNYECYKNNNVLTALAAIAAEGRRVAVFNGYGSELHTKFAIDDEDTALIGEGNFTRIGFDDLNAYSVFCKNPKIFNRCNEEWEKQFCLPETEKVRPDGTLQKKHSIGNNNSNNNNNNNNSSNKRVKRALFTAGSSFE